MTLQEINNYLILNINSVSLGLAANVTHLTREQVRAKWKHIRENNITLSDAPKELDADVEYVYIPKLKAKVRLKAGTTPEEYMDRVTKFKTAYHFNKNVKKKDKW